MKIRQLTILFFLYVVFLTIPSRCRLGLAAFFFAWRVAEKARTLGGNQGSTTITLSSRSEKKFNEISGEHSTDNRTDANVAQATQRED